MSLRRRLLDWRAAKREDAASIAAAEQQQARAGADTEDDTRADDVQAILDAGTGTGFTGAAAPPED